MHTVISLQTTTTALQYVMQSSRDECEATKQKLCHIHHATFRDQVAMRVTRSPQMHTSSESTSCKGLTRLHTMTATLDMLHDAQCSTHACGVAAVTCTDAQVLAVCSQHTERMNKLDPTRHIIVLDPVVWLSWCDQLCYILVCVQLHPPPPPPMSTDHLRDDSSSQHSGDELHTPMQPVELRERTGQDKTPIDIAR